VAIEEEQKHHDNI